ncbi:MAG: membrane protein insertase YidC [Halofilum sp. (in: g-proteobacteria)]|nr:membrane protein insertase YidC [Halofilum sp. (in: g-proteobacteria)]
MDNQRLFLYGALGLLLLLMWQTWQVDYGPAGQRTPEPVAESGSGSAPAEAPEADVPDAPLAEADSDTSAGTTTPEQMQRALPRGQRVHVVTDTLDVTLDTRGGDLRRARLRDYKETLAGDKPIELLSDTESEFFVAQSGLQADAAPAPTHHAEFTAERSEYRLAEGQDTVRVPLVWRGDGVEVRKIYTFHRGSYVIDVGFEVVNNGAEPWVGRQYRQLQRRRLDDSSRMSLLPTFIGAAYYTEEDKYEKIAFEDIAEEPLRKQVEGGWTAMVEHYFVASWAPGADENNTLYTKHLGNGSPRYLIGMYSDAQRVAPGASGRFDTRLYVGPKVAEYLDPVAAGLELTIDYGYLGFVSKWLFVVLDWIHGYVGNWGWAIVLLTLMIKALFYKLSETSYRSMARMRKLQPKIQQLRERHGDDREKMGRAMMDLYKKEKINPLGGCLPILVQIPVFIALYWMLLGSVELRHADWILWINDLSVRDPWYVLPLLMGASMYFQQKLNPAPVDPLQQKIFAALPIIFTVFFAFFPSGLVLYWLTNNLLSIAQQYYITRFVVGDGKPVGKAG